MLSAAGTTVMMDAARAGKYEILKYLAEIGADFQLRDPEDRKALHLAVNKRQPVEAAVLELLLSLEPTLDLEEQVTTNSIQGSVTLLIRAALYGRTSAVQVLLEKGAQVNARTAKGATALHYAASAKSNFATIKLLLEHGADVHAKDTDGRTALHLFVQNGLKTWPDRAGAADAALLLLEWGSDIGAPDNQLRSAVHSFLSLPNLVACHPSDVEACFDADDFHWQNLNTGLDFLLANGANLCAKDSFDENAFHYAVRSLRNECDTDRLTSDFPALSRKLADAGVLPARNRKAITPLHMLVPKLNDSELPYAPPSIVALIAAGDRAWHVVPMGCPGLGGAILDVWKSNPENPEDLKILFYRLSDADKGRCREALRALHRGLPDLQELRMCILSEAMSA